ncbi:MAG: hypothetical protein KJZ59_09655, partial [Pararhodobacter sp.]|nr:hypothetical protein [Pararhodobacter sp.]
PARTGNPVKQHAPSVPRRMGAVVRAEQMALAVPVIAAMVFACFRSILPFPWLPGAKGPATGANPSGTPRGIVCILHAKRNRKTKT